MGCRLDLLVLSLIPFHLSFPWQEQQLSPLLAAHSGPAQQLSSFGLFFLSFWPNTVEFDDLVEGVGALSCLWLREVAVLGVLFQWKHLVLQRRLKGNAMSTSFC